MGVLSDGRATCALTPYTAADRPHVKREIADHVQVWPTHDSREARIGPKTGLGKRNEENEKQFCTPAAAIIGASRGKLRGERRTDTRGTSSK